jgi:four helix bundle protein
MAIESYRDLVVWQKSMDLVVETYRLIKLLPKEEQWPLGDQLRRAVVSVPANIAEGHGRGRIYRKDYVRFLSMAHGSLMEVDTHLQIALRLQYITEAQLTRIYSLLQEVGRMLNGLLRSLEASGNGSNPKQLYESSEPYEID